MTENATDVAITAEELEQIGSELDAPPSVEVSFADGKDRPRRSSFHTTSVSFCYFSSNVGGSPITRRTNPNAARYVRTSQHPR